MISCHLTSLTLLLKFDLCTVFKHKQQSQCFSEMYTYFILVPANPAVLHKCYVMNVLLDSNL